MFNIFKRDKRINTHSIDPDEIFMDTLNVSGFDTQQFEGMIEKSIPKKTTVVALVIFGIIGVVFIAQLIRLQVLNGEKYFVKSENNRLHHTPTFADRGVIYDRNGKELAWNVASKNDEPFSVRDYITDPGFSHLIGYVGYPAKDSSGFFWQNSIVGKAGIEKRLNNILAGTNGQKIVELDAGQHVLSENLVTKPIQGTNVTLTIDAGIQSAMYRAIRDLADKNGFEGGAGVMMDVHTGEVIALTSYPEYDLNILSHGDDHETIAKYAVDPRHVYLNRAMAGLYTPGSTVKPYLALGALNEGLITPNTTVLSVGQVEIPNRYDPTKPQIFRDWKKGGHGVTDVYKAIAESVNTFFYSIGGGYQNQQGLGISRIDEYVRKFGLDQKTNIDIDGEVTGTVPSPEWKLKAFPNDGTWRLGDTYNSSIGQFGFQVTTLALVRAVAAIANGGDLIQPYITKDPLTKTAPHVHIQGIDPKWYTVIHDAMRKTVTAGTGHVADVPYVHAAIKTGTAQVGPHNSFMNSWSTGFFPYENPKYAFVVVMDKAKSTNETGATYVTRQVFDWIWNNEPNFFNQ
jgi:penicillin-binding protein 2